MISKPNAICMIERRIERTWIDLKHCKERHEIEANHAERDTLEYALRIVKDIGFARYDETTNTEIVE